ncbi:hypothetical protein BY996DRAFT_6424331 [Phakopsora pachyrhizi]|nr:hypothetical protein BY996DRAFT_6424331 [Phakopsora pachyrhizi]
MSYQRMFLMFQLVILAVMMNDQSNSARATLLIQDEPLHLIKTQFEIKPQKLITVIRQPTQQEALDLSRIGQSTGTTTTTGVDGSIIRVRPSSRGMMFRFEDGVGGGVESDSGIGGMLSKFLSRISRPSVSSGSSVLKSVKSSISDGMTTVRRLVVVY